MLHAVEMPDPPGPPEPKPVRLDYYTDPLCYWSWVFEPQWQQLRATFGHRFDWGYRLGTLSASSYFACLAVKCAERQSLQAADLYLRALREAALRQRRNIAQPQVLAAVAEEVAARVPAVFDATTLRQDVAANAGEAAFCADLRQARDHQVGQFPTIILQRGSAGPALKITGCRSYEALVQELAQLAPDLFYVASLVDGGAG